MELETYTTIISTAILIISEILPFLPCKSNGIFDFFINFLKTNKKCIQEGANKVVDVSKTHELTTVVTHYTEELLIVRKFKIELEDMIEKIDKDNINKEDIKSSIKKILEEIKASNEKHKK